MVVEVVNTADSRAVIVRRFAITSTGADTQTVLTVRTAELGRTYPSVTTYALTAKEAVLYTAPSRIHSPRRLPRAIPGETKPNRSAADLLFGITALLVCQLIGESTVRLTRLPVPGTVVGMLVLLIVLSLRGAQPQIAVASDRLLAHLPLLFVPAGVGATQYLGLLAREWLPIGVALVASTVLTIAVTAAVMRALASSPAQGAE